ncbi:unnamed protein product [Sphagnum tenellum]
MTPTRRHWSRKHGVWVYGEAGGGVHWFVLVPLRSCTVPEDQVQRTKIFSSELLSTARKHEAGWRRRPLETRAAYAVDD